MGTARAAQWTGSFKIADVRHGFLNSKVVNGKGSHYNMMQGEQAATQAALVLEFAKRLGGVADDISSAGLEAAKSQKMLILRPGKVESSKVYLIHGLDGDALSGGSTFTSIAQRLAPCRVGALVYDQEALECNSIPDLAACYNRRVLEDVKSSGDAGESLIVIAGYSHGCVLAHQMGHQLYKAGVRTAVVMFDLEVTWPPPSTHSRVGGYEFLGGEAEAVLLISRAFGKFDFAIKEAIELTKMKAQGQSIDVDALIERAYVALGQRGLSMDLLKMMVKRGGVNIEKLNNIGNPWEPLEKYEGPALLILAPDTPEFHSAAEINARYCTRMEVVTGKGSHYNMMQGEQAAAQAAIVLEYVKRLSEATLVCPAAEGITVLRDCPGPCIYFLHGLDGDALGPGMNLGSLPSLLSGRICSIEYDDEAFACETIEALAKLYKERILQDRALRPDGKRLVLVGRSIGALVASLIALYLQKDHVECFLVILNSEVVWPSKLDDSFCYDWLGGEVEATFWLSHLAGAKAFVDEQVQSAVTRGKAFAEGASRLQTAAFGQIASNLEAFGIRSLKEFRSVCTLASSHCARLRQLLRPSAGSMRTPAGIFDGKVLVITGAERQSKLEQSARQYFRNIVTRCVNTDDHEVYVGAVASSIASEISQFLVQDRTRVDGDRDPRHEAESLDAAHVPIYVVPGCDGGVLGELASLVDILNADTGGVLVFDQEARRCSSLADLAALFLQRISDDQAWISEGDLPDASLCKVLLLGHSSGAPLAYEMAMQLQDCGVDVRLVIVQGEVSRAGPSSTGLSGCWLGSTCEAILLLANRVGEREFALKEAEAMAKARQNGQKLSRGRLPDTCGLAFDGISGGYMNGHSNNGGVEESKLLMRAFWKLSDQLNGMSVDAFKELVADLASRIDWYMSLDSLEHQDAFEGPALLILVQDCAEAESIIESNALYCTQLEVAETNGDQHSCMHQGNVKSLAAQILSWQVWSLILIMGLDAQLT
ncbi:unnamed protein product [Durusdinium trenchii]|uniref:Oleoyl-[acyl-carrier-protein] hydrolase n=1 Tax=Durusdinium trenchii TaxID=1381693 RepID=A0ABP0S8K4_9DINO